MFKVGDKIVIKDEVKVKFDITYNGTFKRGTDLDQVFEIKSIHRGYTNPHAHIYLTSSDCRAYLFRFEIELAENVKGQMRLPFKWGN